MSRDEMESVTKRAVHVLDQHLVETYPDGNVHFCLFMIKADEKGASFSFSTSLPVEAARLILQKQLDSMNAGAKPQDYTIRTVADDTIN